MAKLVESLPGSDAIGHGYNVFDEYANPKSVILRDMFDFAPQEEITIGGNTWLLSTDINYISVFDTTTETLSERTRDSYSQSLAVKSNISAGYFGFSTTVETDFSTSSVDQSDSSYTSVRVQTNKWKLKLKDSVLHKLNQEFKKNLETMNPFQLFDTYGTHFLTELLVGGRANYVAVSKTSDFKSEQSIKVGAECSYKGTIGTSLSTSEKEEAEHFRKSSSTRLYVLGGNSMSDITDADSYKAWLQSLDSLPVFSEFVHDSLKPLYTLLDASSQRYQLLKTQTQKYVPRQITRPAITDILVIISDSWSEAAPYGYTKIAVDLNEGAGGKYIFLCYKQQRIPVRKMPGDIEPITGLYIAASDSENATTPQGYTQIKKDLNAGAGGKYLYLCYSRMASEAEEGLPIRGLRVLTGDKDSITMPYGFVKINRDLNWGANGRYIYLGYSRHLDT